MSNKSATPEERAAARAWAASNVKLDPKPMLDALRAIYGDAAVLGQDAAAELLGEARPVNWDTWKPGDRASAALLEPSDGLKTLLDDAGITIKGMDDETISRIGSALADGLAAGDPPAKIARNLRATVGSPARALMISLTETARAQSISSMDSYREAGVEQVQWLIAEGDECEICGENADQGPTPIEEPFASGDTEPPAHPNCRCDIAPVIEI